MDAIDAFWEAGGAWLESLNPSIPKEYVDTGSSYPAAWYIPAKTHFKDVFLASGVFIPMLIAALHTATHWRTVVPERRADHRAHHAHHASSHPSSKVAAEGGEEVIATRWLRKFVNSLDYAMRAAVCVTMGATLVYKLIVPNRWSFLLMPCHIQNALLVYLSFARAHTRSSRALWSYSLYTHFGTYLALLMPDTRNQDMPFELTNFWVQHVLLLVLPLLWILKRRFPIPGGMGPILLTWSVFMLQEAILHLAASIYTGFNVLYCMVPSKPQMRMHGTGWRYWWTFLELPLLILFTRYIVVEGFMWLTGVSRFKITAAESAARNANITAQTTQKPAAAPRSSTMELQASPSAGRRDADAQDAPASSGRGTRRRKQA